MHRGFFDAFIRPAILLSAHLKKQAAESCSHRMGTQHLRYGFRVMSFGTFIRLPPQPFARFKIFKTAPSILHVGGKGIKLQCLHRTGK
jgi:hypothetical protein